MSEGTAQWELRTSRCVHIGVSRDRRAGCPAAAVAAIAATAISLRWGSHLVDTGLRACVETVAGLCRHCSRPACWRCRSAPRPAPGCASAERARLGRTHGLPVPGVPNLAGVHVAAFGIDARMVVQGMVPVVFLAAAVAGGARTTRWSTRRSFAIGSDLPRRRGGDRDPGPRHRARLCSRAGRRHGRDRSRRRRSLHLRARRGCLHLALRADSVTATLLASASLLLGGARLQALAMPTMAADWVTLRDLLRWPPTACCSPRSRVSPAS